VISDQFCLIPMSVLRSAPYSLTYGLNVIAKARCYNANGWGAYSLDNTGTGTIMTEPDQMAVPTTGTVSNS